MSLLDSGSMSIGCWPKKCREPTGVWRRFLRATMVSVPNVRNSRSVLALWQIRFQQHRLLLDIDRLGGEAGGQQSRIALAQRLAVRIAAEADFTLQHGDDVKPAVTANRGAGLRPAFL